jgi:hypothetical protein
MFGPRITTVFASRWRALWFAGSILLFAYMSVPEAEAPADINSATATADRGSDGLTEKERERAQKAIAAFERAGSR